MNCTTLVILLSWKGESFLKETIWYNSKCNKN